jgi:protein O-GlcNAc transferase
MDLRSLFEQALAAHRGGDTAQADRLYRQVLRADAGNFPALQMLGYLEGQRGRYDEAIRLLAKALKQRPKDETALTHYGHALLAADRGDEALAAYDTVLAIRPDAVDVLYNRSVVLSGQGRAAEALAALDRALGLQPDAPMILYSRGVVMTQLQRPQEALANYDRALALQPNLTLARGNRAMAALNICDWSRAAQIGPELAQMVATGIPFAPMTLLGYSDDKGLQLQCARVTSHAVVPQPPAALWNGERYGHGRIRLAYVSSDFREHAVAFQLAQLIERHDRSRFEVSAISLARNDASAIRARLVAAFDHFHDFSALKNDEIARRLRKMEIDIAIDLNGHTGGARPEIFALRPAPVQALWLGYPGTSGAPWMDYLIADRIVTPPQDQAFYSERLVHLPDTYFPTDAARPIGPAPSRSEAGLPEDGFVFCAFNNSWKITAALFEIWMRLLEGVPGSVLWLKRPNPAALKNLSQAAEAQGIDPARLVFADDAPLDAHLARQALADIFLDTQPYNAHATASDALWAGLPVLTCRGNGFAGRVAASLLTAIGLPELIAENLADYEAMALRLARDPQALQSLKEKLALNRATAPLFDGERFRIALEAAFTQMLAQRSLGE